MPSARNHKEIAEFLFLGGDLCGLDTETVGCNPKKETAPGRAKLWCMTISWGTDDSVFVPASEVHYYKQWLECDRCPKVGTNLYGYDVHVFRNTGIELRGIVGDTLVMSRLLNPSKLEGHGLKPWAAKLGYDMESFSQMNNVVKHNPEPKAYKRDGIRDCSQNPSGQTWPVSYTKGAPYCTVSLFKTQFVPLDELWERYPARRERVVQYAIQDAKVSRVVFLHLKQKLEESVW